MVNNIRKTSIIPKACEERYLNLRMDLSEPLVKGGVNFSGVSRLRSGYLVGIADPPQSHMVIVTKEGAGILRTYDQSLHLTNSSIVVVPAGNPCEFYVVDDFWHILWFYMDPIERWEELEARGVTLSTTQTVSRLETAMEGFLAETQWFDNATSDYSHGRAARLYSELVLLYLEEALDLSPKGRKSEVSLELENLWRKVQERPDEKWTTRRMAAMLNMSASTFQRVTHKHCQKSPKQVVIDIKMNQARMLLTQTDYPVKVIAERLGYADEFIFSSAFKHRHAIPPSKYRESQMKNCVT